MRAATLRLARAHRPTGRHRPPIGPRTHTHTGALGTGARAARAPRATQFRQRVPGSTLGDPLLADSQAATQLNTGADKANFKLAKWPIYHAQRLAK